jgi:hypothetical protein
MRIPKIVGIIKRRIIVNYRIDPEIIKKQIPAKLNLKLQKGNAIAGICLIRLEQIRPKGIPAFLGSSSENAAHRVAESGRMKLEGCKKAFSFLDGILTR